MYGETKVFPLAKLDRTLTVSQVKKFVEEEECKLPSRLTIAWPEGNKLENNSKLPAGTTIGMIERKAKLKLHTHKRIDKAIISNII